MGNLETRSSKPSSVEREPFVDLAQTIRNTEAWEKWSKYCPKKLLDQGNKTREMIEAQLEPVPPDTWSSLKRALLNGSLGATFEDFIEELQKQDDTITAGIERSNSFGKDDNSLKMWIIRNRRE